MDSPIRRHLFCAALLVSCLASAASAINLSWDDGGGFPSAKDWGNIQNWDPNQLPTGDDIFIGDLAAAQNDTTIIDQDFSIASLLLSNGADADTSGNRLDVSGDISLMGAGVRFIAAEHSGGPTSTAVTADDINGADFLQIQRDNRAMIPLWQSQYPNPLSALSELAAVPEPAGLLLTMVAGLIGCAGRRG